MTMASWASFGTWFKKSSEINEQRWVVLDVESSGLNIQQDQLLSIGCIAIGFYANHAHIELGDSFEVVLRQKDGDEMPDKANILLHGIGVGAQRAGVAQYEALQAFAAYVGNSPLLAFHAAFDEAMIARSCRVTLGFRLRNPWLDIEHLACVVCPHIKARSLDEWLMQFGIHCGARHQAASDALATAELLQKLWPQVRLQMRKPGFRSAAKLAAHRKWLPP